MIGFEGARELDSSRPESNGSEEESDRPLVEQDGRVILDLIGSVNDSSSPAQVMAMTDLPPHRVTRALRRLRALGLVEGSQRTVRLSVSGWAALTPAPAPVGDFERAVTEVFEPWPAALVRLLADAVVARRLLPDRSGRPAFAVYGLPGSGKTAIGVFLCRCLGWDSRTHVLELYRMSPGEVLGRRRQVAGASWTFDPAPATRLQFVCLDELGTAQSDLRREVFAFAGGESEVLVEGQRIPMAPTALVTFNPTGNLDSLFLSPSVGGASFSIPATTTTPGLTNYPSGCGSAMRDCATPSSTSTPCDLGPRPSIVNPGHSSVDRSRPASEASSPPTPTGRVIPEPSRSWSSAG